MNGIKFRDILDNLEEFCEFEPNPNGAPLGEEPTQYSYFDEAGCKGWGNFSAFAERKRFAMSGASLKQEGLYDRSLCARWNPNGDTLIHLVFLNFSDYSLLPVEGHKWNESQTFAPKIYKIYKDLFVKFKCDEAQATDEHLSVLFHWVRRSNYQSVIDPYEIRREMSEDEAQGDQARESGT